MNTISRRSLFQVLGAGGAAVAVARCGGPDAYGTSAAALSEDRHRNRFTHEYGVRYPFVCAGMAFVSMPPLVAAVTNAGGIGILGAAPAPPPIVQGWIHDIKSMTSGTYGVDLINATSAFGPMCVDGHIDVCVAEQVPIVVFYRGAPTSTWVDRIHGYGGKVWMQVGSVAEALDAVAAGVDLIIAQGVEAGGHNHSEIGVHQLVRQIREAVEPVMVLAAGGITTGRDVFEARRAGAEGVWVGTRLVASAESNAADEWKQRIVLSGPTGNSTTFTTMFGPEWPGQRMRVLRNRVVNEWAGHESDIPNPPPPPDVIGMTSLFGFIPYPMPKFCALPPTVGTTGDFEEMALLAGTGCTRIESVMSAGDIVLEMMAEAGLALGCDGDR